MLLSSSNVFCSFCYLSAFDKIICGHAVFVCLAAFGCSDLDYIFKFFILAENNLVISVFKLYSLFMHCSLINVFSWWILPHRSGSIHGSFSLFTIEIWIDCGQAQSVAILIYVIINTLALSAGHRLMLMLGAELLWAQSSIPCYKYLPEAPS